MRYGSHGESSGPAVKEIPYDYVATFKLSGKPGNRVQDIITISTEGTFVAVSVACSFVPASTATAVPAAVPAPFGAAFDALFPAEAAIAFKAFADAALFKVAAVQFLYTIVDSGSGRELQNKAVHSVAGLGAADGDRPFRPFARPVPFVPRATIRIEIEEISAGPLFKDGTLFFVLHGYKRLE